VAVLRPGDQVIFDGGEHQVVALAGTSVRLRSAGGAEQVVLGAHLMASPGFEVTGGAALAAVEPFGLLEGLPAAVLAAARDWERHVVETETGLPPDALPGTVPRAGFDPAATTLAQRDSAKAAELGVGVRTVQQRRAAYGRQGCGAWWTGARCAPGIRPGGRTPGWSRRSRTRSTLRPARRPGPGRG
jgi:hypothetical protein